MNDSPAAAPSDAATLAHQVAQATDLVRALLAGGLLSPESLGLPAATANPPLVPGQRITVADLVAKTLVGFRNPNTKRTYATYLRLLADGWPAAAPPEERMYAGIGAKWADEVLPSDLEHALRVVDARARLRAHWRGIHREAAGRVVRRSEAAGARYNAVGAWRRMFKVAVKDRHLAKGFDPSQEIAKPRRLDGARMALDQRRYDELWQVVRNTGDDPELDELICETIVIAGARQEGILNLDLGGIDREECAILLDEKFGIKVWQPVPDWFVDKLFDFATARGARHPADPVFRKRGKRGGAAAPITNRRFDNLFVSRLQARCLWADEEHVTGHTLRHHAITVIERRYSKAIAMAFARHAPADTNDIYSRASRAEVAAAVVDVYGGDHPWLHREPRPKPV